MDSKLFSAELDDEEREILDAFEQGETAPVPDMEAKIVEYQEAARAYFRKDRRVNIRITNRDLLALQEIAQEEGLPYQTLMASILHKYVTGRLVERPRRLTSPAPYLVHEESEPYDE